MPISFPASPTSNQTYQYGNRTYRWTGAAWEFVASGGSGSVTIGDPLWDSTVLMLHCNSLADSSSLNATPTAAGGAAATGSPKFGINSLTLDGNGDYVSYGSNPQFAFGTGDFTVECWFKAAEVKDQYMLMIDATGGLGFGFESGSFVIGRRGVATDHQYTYAPTVGAWTHYAACRSGTTIRMFINGTQVLSATNTQNYTVTGPVVVGGIAALAAYSCNGQIDEFRITRAARYPSATSFTPQTAAFVDGPSQTLTITGSGGGSGLSWSSAPASATATGTAGSIAYDGDFFYIATATNTWERAALSTWTPVASIAGLQLWLDASDASTLFDATSGGSLVAADGGVARWEDRSGNARHATQSTSGNRPLRKAAVQGGKDVLRFDGSNDSLSIPSSTETFKFLHSADNTVFVVMKSGTTANPQQAYYAVLWTSRASGTSSGYGIGTYDSPNNDSIQCWVERGVAGPENLVINNVIFDGFPSNTFALASFGTTPSNGTAANRSSYRKNGGVATKNNTLANAVSTANSEGDLTIGSLAVNPNYFLNGDIAEIIIYNAALSDTDRAAVEQYLIAKWAIT